MSKKSCTVCDERHTLLHDAFRETKNENSDATTSHIAQNRLEKRVTILLATARALVDQGSETSFVSEALDHQRLRLPRKQASVTVIGVGGSKSGVAKGRITMKIMPHFNNSALTITALVLPRLTAYSGGSNVSAQAWTHVRNLELADPEFLSADSIDILLEADVFSAILASGVKKGGPQEPVAQKTSLGWILSGSLALNEDDKCNQTVVHQCITTESLTELVRRFWEQEEIPTQTPVLTEDEQLCEELYTTTHTRDRKGRYVVRLLLAKDPADLSPTKHAARRSLMQMERRFVHDNNLQRLYIDFMQQYVTLGHMSAIKSSETEQKMRMCYLPHHGVLRESSITTKLRVVFNGSWTLLAGESLNKHLLTGQNLLSLLTDILLHWRMHRFVMASDIEKMYRQILVHPDDRDLQRILWRFPTIRSRSISLTP